MVYTLPALQDWEATRDTLHAYPKVVGAVPRAFAELHPKWWHVSLKVTSDRLKTDRFRPAGHADMTLQLMMDIHDHTIKLYKDQTLAYQISMKEGLSTSGLANVIEDHIRSLGIEVELKRAKFEGETVGSYNPLETKAYFDVLSEIIEVLSDVKAELEGETGIVQFWPHNFDLAFKWFSDKMIQYMHEGKTTESHAQINFGFAPGDSSHPRPYFYSNPWPLEERYIQEPLPSGAGWFQESWRGSLLAYDTLVGDGDFRNKLKDYYSAIYDIATPILAD